LYSGPDGGLGTGGKGEPMTSAFEDVFLVPIASWIFLPLFVWFIVLAVQDHRRAAESHMQEPSKHFLRWRDYLKLFFALGVIAMACLEIARLAKLGYGIGLLPFTPVTVAIAVTFNVSRSWNIRKENLSLLVIPYYLCLLAFESMKLQTQIRLEKSYPRRGSQYPARDQIIDLAVIVACLVVLVPLTFLDLRLG
jgi:hypothetical protein